MSVSSMNYIKFSYAVSGLQNSKKFKETKINPVENYGDDRPLPRLHENFPRYKFSKF